LAGDGYQTQLNQLLPVKLPSAEQLPTLLWYAGCERHFLQVPSPNLKVVTFTVGETGAFPSRDVFEALLSLENFGCTISDQDEHPSLVQSVLSALRGGVAFQCLREFGLEYRHIQIIDLDALLDALADAACAFHLECLKLYGCQIDSQSIGKLAEHLAQDKFPALKHLNVGMSFTIADAGIVALCNGLLSAPCTRLASLDLSGTLMDHLGMATLGDVIRARRLTRLETLQLTHNVNMTDKSVFILAGAIQQTMNALPRLRTMMMSGLRKVTGVAVGVLVTTIIHNCPQIELVDMGGVSNRAGRDSLIQMLCTLNYKGTVRL